MATMTPNHSSSANSTIRKKTVGYGFHPTDSELVGHFLNLKLSGSDNCIPIAEVKICDYEPWDLPDHSKIKSNGRVWYFFSSRDSKYANSKRSKRTTKEGQWRVTGKFRNVKARGSKKIIGKKTTLVYYKNQEHSKDKRKTDWTMHEYDSTPQGNFVVCKLKRKSKKTAVDEKVPPSALSCESPMTVNSSCGECEVSNRVNADFEVHSHDENAAVSSYNKDEGSCTMEFDFRKLNDEEVATNSFDENELCQQLDFRLDDQTLSSKVKSCFKLQNSGSENVVFALAGDNDGIQDSRENLDMAMPAVSTGLEINTVEALEVYGPPTFFDDMKTISEPEGGIISLRFHL